MSAILEARKRANLTVAEIARAVGRTPTWLDLVEIGQRQVTPEEERIILTAIGRLARFNATVAEAKLKLTVDLKLPPVASSRGSHAP